MTVLTATVPLVRAVAGHGLPGARGSWPRQPLDDGAWSRLVAEVQHQRLDGLLLQAVLDEVLPVTPAQRLAVQQGHVTAVCASLLLESSTLRTLGVLEAANVQATVLKGPAVAHLDYPDPALRLFGDVDLLIAAEDFDRGIVALQAAGYQRRFPQPRPGFDRRFSKGTSFRTPDGTEVDYHRSFVMGPFGLRLRTSDLWQGERRFDLGGSTVRALDDETRFLHACFHAALGNVVPRLVPQRDVAQMLLSPRLDLERVRALAGSWGAEPVLARALLLVSETLSLEDLPLLTWARERVLTRGELADLAVYSDPEGGYAGKSLRALLALPSLRDRAAFLRALAFPDRSYVRDRHSGSSARWARGLQAARRLRSRS